MCSFEAMTSLGSQRHGGIAHRTGVLQWMDKGFLGRTAWEGEEGSCPLCERAAGIHGALPWDRSGASQELMGQD